VSFLGEIKIKKKFKGNLLGDIVKRIKLKLECLNKNDSKCSWISNLKYFAYSAHDTTVAGFLCTLGDEESVAGTGRVFN